MTTPDNPGYGQPPGEPPSLQKPPQGYGAPPPGYAAPPQGFASPPQGFGSPPTGYGAPAGSGGPGGYAPKMSNGLGVAALVIGIISIPFSFIVVGGAFGVLAIIFGFVGRSKVKKGEANNPGVALAGILTGALAFVIAVIIVIIAVVVVNSDTVKKLRDCTKKAGNDPVAVQVCNDQFGKRITG